MKKSIREKGILSSLKIRRWSAQKSDSDAAKEVERVTGAKAGSGKYTKSLIDPKALSEIASVYTSATKYHESVTMPWFDNGFRILPAVKFTEYTAKMREFKTDFEKAVQVISDNYTGYIRQAQTELGSMFKLHEYPTASEIENSFRFDTAFMPLPDYTDFRIDLNNAEITALQSEMKAQQETALKAMETDLFNRIYKAVERVVERLTSEGNKFKGSIDALEELLELVPSMNISDNKKLTEIIKTAKTEIVKDTESIKTDSKLRETVTTSAETLLETLGEYANCF